MLEENNTTKSNYSTHTAHHTMKQRAVVIIIILFVLIVLGMFSFAYLKSKESTQSVNKADNATPPAAQEDRYSYISRVDAKHYYIDGEHTVVGEIPMPTPCDLLQTDAVVAESYPEQITIRFSVINTADFCSETITPARFKVSAEASKDAKFYATFQNRTIELNLIEALEGESPDDFEVFLKG